MADQSHLPDSHSAKDMPVTTEATNISEDQISSDTNEKESLGSLPTLQGHHSEPEFEQIQKEKAKEADLELGHAISANSPPYSIFNKHQKRFIVFMAAFACLFSALSANMYFPALNTLAQDLHVTPDLINLTLTSYMIFQGLAPTIYGDLADVTGRRPAYVVGFIIFLAANLGLALQSNYAALFVLRCIQSSGSSGVIALGNGVVADISTMAERGMYMGYVSSGVMVGPAVGPILGGLLSQFLGWRSIFWFLVILTAVFLIPLIFFFPETGRQIVGNGALLPQKWNRCVMDIWKAREVAESHADQQDGLQRNNSGGKLKWPNPLRVVHVIFEKDVSIILLYNSLVYTAYFDITTSLPGLSGEIYHFNDLQIGLSFIPYGFGCIVASFLTGKLMDLNYSRIAKANNLPVHRQRGVDIRHFPIEKARIQVLAPVLVLGIMSIICYGWVLEYETSLAAPLILLFGVGLGLVGAYDVMCVMLVDLYPESPSTATAANNLVRCLLGAGGTGIIAEMIRGMGRGWCFTFIGLVLAATSPLLFLELKRGSKWREERRIKAEEKDGK